MKENASKEKYYDEDSEVAAKDFVAAEVQAKTTDANFALLMVELAPSEGRELTIKEAARLETARKIAIKCQCPPGAAARRLMIATMKETPKAVYGWFCGKTSKATFRQVDRATTQVGPDPKVGDPNLKTFLRGHTASALFMSGIQLVMAAWRRAMKQGTTPGVWREIGWTHNLRNFMKSVGCEKTANRRWYNSLGGIIDLDPESKDFDKTNGLMAHHVREAWRTTLFDRWRTRGRMDAKLCATQTYKEEERCSLTRKLTGTDGHRFAVAAGAAVSPQKFSWIYHDNKQERPETAVCPWCGPCAPGQGLDWKHKRRKLGNTLTV